MRLVWTGGREAEKEIYTAVEAGLLYGPESARLERIEVRISLTAWPETSWARKQKTVPGQGTVVALWERVTGDYLKKASWPE